MLPFPRHAFVNACGFALVALMLFALVGCHPPVPPPPPEAYYGPTENQLAVLTAIRANNRAIRSLWARHDFAANIKDDKGERHQVDGDGMLIFSKPHNMRLIGNKDIAGNVFEIGSNQHEFWMKIVPEVDTMWWGRYVNLGKPCTQDIPIRPDLVAEVLGISDVDQNPMREPFPVMRFDNDADAYVFDWIQHGGNFYIAQKEIWYARVSKLPIKVLLYDTTGRIILQAKLSKHQEIEGGGVIATHYDLLFPETASTMMIDLHQISQQHNGVPNARSFPFPTKPGVSKVNQVDAACGQ